MTLKTGDLVQLKHPEVAHPYIRNKVMLVVDIYTRRKDEGKMIVCLVNGKKETFSKQKLKHFK